MCVYCPSHISHAVLVFFVFFVVVFVQIRTELEQHMNCNLKEYKEFIDNEMLLILGQMDKATLIFDHVYLVGKLMLSLTLTETFATSVVSCE